MNVERNADIEAHIFEAPDEPERYIVYADWLTEHGHPLGQLMATQLAASREPPRKRKLKLAANRALKAYVDAELGQYPALRERLLSNRRNDWSTAPDDVYRREDSNIVWRWGFIRSISTSDWTAPMTEPFWRLIEDEHVSLVERLNLSSMIMHDFAPFRRLRNLRSLTSSTPYTYNLPTLADLEPLERLEVLELWDTDVADLGPIASLPLRHLRLGNSRVEDLGPLRGHPTLEYLDIGWNPVSDVTPLFECPALQRVDLSGTGVSGQDLAELDAFMKARGGFAYDQEA